MVYRYSIFANQYGTNGSSGQGELGNVGQDDIFGGNDFFVTLGAWGGGDRQQQSGTFMHELGHTVGLFHGGHQGDENKFNRKPNYHSVMNYIWQFPYLPGLAPTADEAAFATSWILDYSRDPFNDLNENHINETTGIGGHAGHVVRLENGNFVPESGPVDWDGDGSANDTDVAVDVNATSSRDTLEGSEDWSRLRYAFRTTRNFADGEHGPVDPIHFTLTDFEELNDALIYAPAIGNGADHVTLRLNGGMLEVFDNNVGVVVKSRALADTRLIQIIGARSEDDRLSMDFNVGGFFALGGGIEFLGGDEGSDGLAIVGTGATTGAYTPSGVTPGNGTANVALGAESVIIAFSGLEPTEVSGMASYAMVTPNSADALALSGGLSVGGKSAYVLAGTSGGVAFESLTFFDVTNFTLDTATNDGAAPDDSVTVSTGLASAGVLNLNVRSGAGADAIHLSASPNAAINVDAGTGIGDTLHFAGESLTYEFSSTSFTTATRQPAVYAGVETVALSGGVFHATGTVVPNVVVNSHGTLGGDGTIQGTVSASAGGIIDPGVSGTGILGAGNVSFSNGATYQVQLNGLTFGTQHDELRVTGTVNLDGATLAGSLGFNAIPGDELVIIRNDASDPIVGQFTGGGIVTIGGKKFAVDYAFDGDVDGQFNDVALIRYGAELAPDPCDPDKMALFVSATTGDDIVRLIPAPRHHQIQVLINGEDEGTFRPTGLLIGFGQAGNDTISVELPSRDAWLYGQGGDDTLLTRNGNSILLGGLGNDHLISGNGKDILIGGAGADVLVAGNGNDLLIAGSTTFDSNSAANRAALCHIREKWLHGWGCYTNRIQHLRFGGGKNGTTLLNALTVLDDASVDHLFGNNGRDWFMLNHDGGGVLDTSDRKTNETATDI